MTGSAFFSPVGRGHAFTLSFRASGLLRYAGVVFRVIMIAGMTALADRDSAAWNLGQGRGVMLDECGADVASVCSSRQGFYAVMLALATGCSWAIAKETVQGVCGQLGDSSVALKNRAPSE